ncbi:MAG TPA: hypothetical protein VHZ09_03725 [Acidobacteriaceae bacterium]|jgi:hypothetical protein|nr:hypothetical protein [Acidobacteriaceae bacterium]
MKGSLKDLRKRVDKLESQLKVNSVELHLENGKTLHIRRGDVLKITTAGMRRRYAEIEGLPRPTSRFDRELDLLWRIACPPANAPLLQIVCGFLRRGDAEN